MKRKTMTLEEHIRLPTTLKDLRRQLFDIQGCFPVSSKEGRLLERWDGYISVLKNVLDDVVCRDYPDGAPEKVYYGNIIIDAPQYSLYNVQYDTR